jgi:hypothetical protein
MSLLLQRATRILLVMGLLGPTLALAEHPALGQASAAFEDLDFERSLRLYRTALEHPATRAERIRAWKGLAISAASLGLAREAREAFETLLQFAPDQTVDPGLGPKVLRPFEQARKAVANRTPPSFQLSRDRLGALSAKVNSPPPLAASIRLHAIIGQGDLAEARDLPTRSVQLDIPPELTMMVWVRVLDANDGVLLEKGSKRSPIVFPGSSKLPAVSLAMEHEALDRAGTTARSGRSNWPWWVGGAVAVVGAGVTAAVMLNQPQPLQLPPADRTGQLP